MKNELEKVEGFALVSFLQNFTPDFCGILNYNSTQDLRCFFFTMQYLGNLYELTLSSSTL